MEEITKLNSRQEAFTQYELMQLLEINTAITNAKTFSELISTIRKRVMGLIPFHDTGILIVEKDGLHHYDLAVDIRGWDHSEACMLLQQEDKLVRLVHRGSYVDFIMQQLEEKKGPIIEDWKSVHEQWEHPFFPFTTALGYRDALVTLLKSGSRIYGALWLNSSEKNFFREEQFALFQAVAEQVAVAVGNILANDEILHREKEMAILLTINKAISSARNARELLTVLREKVMQLIPFYDTGILIVEKDGLHHYDLAVNIRGWDDSEANLLLQQQDDLVKVVHPGSHLEFVLQQLNEKNEPVIEDWDMVFEKWEDPFFPFIKKAGYKEGVVTLLKSGGRIYGALWLNSLKKNHFKKQQFPLFQAIAEQVSVAVANILADEEVIEREREKTLLYTIASIIAKVKDRHSLMKLILEEVKSIFSFYDVGLAVLDSDGVNCTDWSTLNPGISPSEANYKIHGLNLSKLPFKDSLFEKLIIEVEEKGHPIVVRFNEQLKKDYPDLKQLLEVEMKFGYKEALVTYLKSGNKIMGIFNINSLNSNHFKTSQFNLFQAVADLVAVAVANILANEEITKKAIQIENLNKQLQAQNEYLIEEVEQRYNFDEMIGQNSKFEEVCRNIGLVAKTDTTALILGETGTGKELVARAIHNNSPRKNKPLIKLNCAALPANLIESELFGHERGAFTGAIERRIGKFELANGSTLFLDEVGELPLDLQAKLLRALQEKEIERLGSNKTLQIDVRIIAATNRELEKEVQAGKFRQDLYYRLHIFPITLPGLRERKEDIPLLAAHFIERYAKKNGKKIQGFSSDAMRQMMQYNWPGNIRELEHVIERCVILSNTRLINNLNLPDVSKTKIASSVNDFAIKSWHDQERDYILEVLKFTGGNLAGKGGAAELLQLPASTLQSKMNKLGIRRKYVL